jgi:small redox-active disulfide protein 2
MDKDLSSLVVRVLGPGCVNCQKLERETLAVLSELNLAADFEHIRDILEIARYRVLGIPALVINGQVKCAGRVPGREQIKTWLLEGMKEKGAQPKSFTVISEE